jgi:hypothetical protein
MLKKKLFLFVCFCLLIVIAGAQTVITGRVFNAQHEPVVAASIKIKDSSKGLIRSFAISNSKGAFSIRVPASMKNIWLECSFIGYATYSESLAVNADGLPVQKDILLSTDTALLPEINVRSLPPVSVSGDTTTFQVSAFKKGDESNVGELLNNIPGFNVNNGRISYNGKAVTRVLIEDDDLFGTNYNTITQNLSVKGIEKVQVIENYNDKTYLTNRLRKGNEQVVNLKFNKKYLYKFITSNEVGTSLIPAVEFYRIRQNIISLIPKFKTVITTNFNNTGVLGATIAGSRPVVPLSNSYRNEAISFDHESVFPSTPVTQFADISPAAVPKEKTVFNNTALITGNLLYKVSWGVVLKSVVQYYHDTYHQSQSRTEDYSVSGTNLVVSNDQFLRKKLPFLNISAEGIFTISKLSQLIYRMNVNSRSENDSLFNYRQSVNTYAKLGGNARNFQQELAYSIALDSARMLDIRVFHSRQSADQDLAVRPAYIYKPIVADSFFAAINPMTMDDHNEYGLFARFSAKAKQLQWSIDGSFTNSRSSLHSTMRFVNPDSSFTPVQADLHNELSTSNTISQVNFYLSAPLSRNLSFHTTQRVETGSLYHQYNAISQHRNNYTHYLPSFNLKLSVGRNQSISFDLNYKNKLAQVYDLASGVMFTSGTTLARGADSAQVGISQTYQLSYSYADYVRRKLSLIVSASYGKDPMLYLANQAPTDFYSFSSLLVSRQDVTRWVAFAWLYKYIPAIKSQVDIQTNVLQYGTFYSTNLQRGTLAISSVGPSVNFKTLVTDKLTLGAGIKASFSTQLYDKGKSLERKSSVTAQQYKLNMVYGFSPVLILNMQYQYIVQQQGSMRYAINLADMGIKYTAIKDKLHFLLSGNNLFASDYFASSYFTNYALVTQSTAIIQPYLMIQANIEL